MAFAPLPSAGVVFEKLRRRTAEEPSRRDPGLEEVREDLREAAEGRHRPVLAVDVDGVISLFGFDEPLEQAPGDVVLVDGIAHCISRAAGERLVRLSNYYDLIWATGWEERANEHLPLLLGLPGELPYLTFGGNARFGSAHWKLDAIDAYAGDRPLAWIDDNLDEHCHTWAASRTAPTLLVETEPSRGLEEAHVDALIAWQNAGFRPR
jgi:class 3 adenylate cyclase